MPFIITTLGRGLVPVRVEYDTEEVEIDRFDNRSGREYTEYKTDVSVTAVIDLEDGKDLQGRITEEVFKSLESDCREWEAVPKKHQIVNVKKVALRHYTRQAEIAGAV
jgi:hypothetical protein